MRQKAFNNGSFVQGMGSSAMSSMVTEFLPGQAVVNGHHQHPRLVVEDGDAELVGRERQPGHRYVHAVL